jgi:two-component system sensor histidine kinase CpxA
MNIRDRTASMPLVWKLNIFITSLLVFVVILVEIILEPLAEVLFANLNDESQSWLEIVIWGASIVIPSIICSYILSKILSTKLGRMARISKTLAQGNLNARLPVAGNDKDEFDVLAQNFNDMAEAIENQMNNERRLLADISHELRTPLTNMTIAAELLPRRDGEEKANIIQRLNKEIAHMNELVSLLLAQARDKFILSSDADRMVNLNEVLQDVADHFAFQSKADKKRVEIMMRGAMKINGKPLLLRRMFSNLLSNALFYTPVGGKIEIYAEISGGNAVMTMRDYGPGVPEEHLQDIFRAFYRVDDSRARISGGVGLGLALAREAAIAHNGSVDAANANPGLLITVALPLTDAA